MLSVLQKSLKITWCGCLAIGSVQVASAAGPLVPPKSAYINMPSAVVEQDGAFSAGYSYDSPYATIYTSVAILPYLQVTGRYVAVSGVRAFEGSPDGYGSNYGRNKDKVVDAKLRLFTEGEFLPDLSVGATDLFGTQLFKGQYLVATKHFGPLKNFEASIGYGRKRPDGMFAAARWVPAKATNWALVAEYDANDYQNDYRAADTYAGERRKGPALAVEYRWGWLGAQLARHRDHFSANVSLTVPFNEREFIPKIFEPAYFKPEKAPPRATMTQWMQDEKHGRALMAALAAQDFKNIRVRLDRGIVSLSLTNSRISNLGRAVGRASRTALAFVPVGTNAIHITYTQNEQPVTTYEFFDLAKMTDYLAGRVDRNAFLQGVLVRYAHPGDRIADEQGMLAGVVDGGALAVHMNKDGNVIQLSSEDRENNRFKIVPKVGFFFNDPSGALRYEVAAAANYDKRLGEGLYLNSALRLSVVENISGVTQASNSNLPHVRTDIAEYKREGRFKLNRLLLNKYMNPAERWYVRGSAGFYEEMFRGVGGQVLYLPPDQRWAADLSVDALEQRGYEGWFGKRDYRTVTAIGALHYRLPYGITATARAGQFLAKDQGVRLEFKRRFRSGIEVGAWYTKTNGRDITSPGTPASPYNDKGIFMSIPLNSMLPSDSQALAGFALAPWTRDVGQMVTTPGDLYEMVERPRNDMHAYDGLGNFAERPDEQNLNAVAMPVQAPRVSWPAFRLRLEQSAAATPPLSTWMKGGAVATGAVLASAALDKPADKFFSKHEEGRVAKTWGNFGKNMPIALVATAGTAVALGDERMQNMGIISLQSVAGALGVTAVGKYVTGRARPGEERGPWSSVGDNYSRGNSSFPSGHSAVAFAAVTPFAKEYDAPWLYGVAAVSSMGRVANRQHWVSDVVAGGLVGYAMGSILWQGQRDNTRSRLSVMPGPKEISVAWQTSY
ncbi:MAG: YjbH domain-containing protein [Pseudomonadota bacterium]